MYSWLCPWLLTWSDYGEDNTEGEGGYDDVVQTRNVSQSVACRVVGMTWVINTACVRCSIVDLPCVAISDLVM
jgi:hypothetical protein